MTATATSYASYLSWCQANDRQPVSRARFVVLLDRLDRIQRVQRVPLSSVPAVPVVEPVPAQVFLRRRGVER